MRFEWTPASDTGEICFLAQTQGFLPEVISPSLRAKAENIAAEIVNVLDDGEAVYMPILGRSITKRIYDGTDVVTLEEKPVLCICLTNRRVIYCFPTDGNKPLIDAGQKYYIHAWPISQISEVDFRQQEDGHHIFVNLFGCTMELTLLNAAECRFRTVYRWYLGRLKTDGQMNASERPSLPGLNQPRIEQVAPLYLRKRPVYRMDILGNSPFALDYIVQQVNCKGVMGAGLARQIRAKWPGIYAPYAEICRNKGAQALGTMFPYATPDNGPVICNCFAQDGYGRDKQYTSYEHLRESLLQAKKYASIPEYFLGARVPKSMGIPYGLGCGLAGGDWNVVYNIINDVFYDCDDNYLHIYICKLPERRKEELK